jgi:hypothetical protein
MSVDAFGAGVTIAVLLAVALFILLFEKKRATGIQRDLKNSADEQHRNGHTPND